MREITIKLYQFNELSDKAKEKARDWYREITAGDNYFADYIQDEFKSILKSLGYTVGNLYWSGFSSQGDGACFTGSWSAAYYKPTNLLKDFPTEKTLHYVDLELGKIAKARPDLSFKIEHSGRYVHDMSTSFDFQGPELEDQEKEIADAEYLKELSRDLMKWFYKALETAYCDSQSDETVDANILVNEYEFTIDGKPA